MLLVTRALEDVLGMQETQATAQQLLSERVWTRRRSAATES